MEIGYLDTGTGTNYDVATDGRFVMIRPGVAPAQLNVILNWTEKLKQLVPRDK